jgi:hypothetical protein
METQIISLQFALFFQDIIERPDTEFSDLNMNLMNIFGDVPLIMPIPPELPPEVPRVTLKSENKAYICQIARSRVDLISNRISKETSNEEMLKDFNAKVRGFIKYVLEKRKIVRFGMICKYFHKDDDAITTIKNKYFNDNIGDVAELSIQYNKISEYQGFQLNDLVSISAKKVKIAGETMKGIQIQRDINNAPVDSLSLEKLQQISNEYARCMFEAEIAGLIK